MSGINGDLNPFMNRDIYAKLEQPVKGQDQGKRDPALQEQFGSYKKSQLDNLAMIKRDNFRSMVNYVNPRNKGAVRFSSDFKLEKCNNKIDIGSWRWGLGDEKKNRLMRQTFANALGPGLRFIADKQQLESLMALVTGAKLTGGAKILGGDWKSGDKIHLSASANFSSDRLERTQIRDAFEIYDRAFNTKEGRKAAVDALLKSNGWSENLEDRNSFCLRMFGQSFKRVFDHKLLMTVKEWDEGAMVKHKDKKDIEHDLVELALTDDEQTLNRGGMYFSDEKFLAQLEVLEQRLKTAQREQHVGAELSALVGNYDPGTGTFHSDDALRSKFSGLLWKSLQNRLPPGSVEKHTLIAYTGSFGGKDPMNIFMDKVFDKALGDLMKKYAELGEKPVVDSKLGMRIYNEMVQIASNYIQTVQAVEKVTKSYYDEQNQPIARPNAEPSGQAGKDVGKPRPTQKQAINFSAETINQVVNQNGLVQITISPKVNGDDKRLQELKSSHAAIKELFAKKDEIAGYLKGKFGVEVANGQLHQLKENLPGLVLEAQVLSLTDNFTGSEELYQAIVRKPEEDDELAKELKGVYADGDLPVLDENFLFSTFDSDKVKGHFKDVLSGYLKNTVAALKFEYNEDDMSAEKMMDKAMTEIIELADKTLGGNSFLGKIMQFFKSNEENQRQKNFANTFRDAAISGLLNRYFEAKIQEAISNKKDVPVLYGDLLPVLKYLEAIAGKIEKQIQPMRDKLDRAEADVDRFFKENGKGVHADDLNLLKDQVKSRLRTTFDGKIREFLLKMFGSININDVRLENPNALDLSKSATQKLNYFLERQVSQFSNDVAGKMGDILKAEFSENSTAFKTVMNSVQRYQKDLLNLASGDFTDALGLKFADGVKGIALFSRIGNQPNEKVDAMLNSIGSNIATRLVIDNYGKYAAVKTTVDRDSVLNDVKAKVKASFDQTFESVNTYAAATSAAILDKVRDNIRTVILNNKSYGLEKDSALLGRVVDTIAQKILVQNLTSFEASIVSCVSGAFSDVTKGGKLNLPTFDKKKGVGAFDTFMKQMDASGDGFTQKIVDEIKELGKVGQDVRYGLDTIQEFAARDILAGDDLKFFESLAGPEFAKKYPQLNSIKGAESGGTNEFGMMFLFNHLTYLRDNTPLSNLEIAVIGKDGFKKELATTFKQEVKDGRVTNFKQYLEEAEALFAEVKGTFNLPDEHLVKCRERAFFDSNGVAVRNAGVEFSVEDMKKRYHGSIINAVKGILTSEQSKAGAMQEMLGSLFNHIHAETEKAFGDWYDTFIGEKNDLLRMTQMAVFRPFVTKAAVEFTNLLWAVEEEDVKKGVPFEIGKFKLEDYSKTKAEELKQYSKAKIEKFVDRVDKMITYGFNKFIGTVMYGLRTSIGSNRAFLDFLLSSYLGGEPESDPAKLEEQIKNLNEGDQQRVRHLLENQDGLVSLTTNNVIDTRLYFQAMTESVAGYWNECCNRNVFAEFANEARIDDLPKDKDGNAVAMQKMEVPPKPQPVPQPVEEVRPEEVKPEEIKQGEVKPEEVKVEAKVEEVKQEEVKPEEVKPEVKDEVKEQPAEEPKVEKEPGILDRGSFQVNVNSGEAKMERLKTFLKESINADLTSDMANEAMNSDMFMMAAEMLLKDKDFIRQTCSHVLGIELDQKNLTESIENAVRKIFLGRVRTALEQSIDAALNKQDEKVTFDLVKSITLENRDFELALDAVANASWAMKSVGAWFKLSDEVKDPIIKKLDEFLEVPNTRFDSFSTDMESVKSMCLLARSSKGAMIGDILSMIPVSEFLPDTKSMKDFLQNGKLPDGLSVEKIFDRWLTKAISGKVSTGDPMFREISQMVASKQVKSRETLIDRLACYKGFIQKSVDEISTTRGCLSSSFASQYARGEGFKRLFLTGPFAIDGLDGERNERLKNAGLTLPEPSQKEPSCINSYDEFTRGISDLLKKPDVRKTLMTNYKMVVELFGHNNIMDTFDNLAINDFGEITSNTIKALNLVLDDFGELFALGVKTRMEVKKVQYDADARLLNDTETMEQWRAERKLALDKQLANTVTNKKERAKRVEAQLEKELAEVWARVTSFDFGMSETEAKDICNAMQNAVISLVAAKKSKALDDTEEVSNVNIANLFSKLELSTHGNAEIRDEITEKCEKLADSVRLLTNPDIRKRNNFNGFTKRFRILMSIVEGKVPKKLDI